MTMLLMMLTYSASAKKNIVSREISYMAGKLQLKGVMYYDAGQKGKMPAVMVVHEWWGCNDYAKRRARMMAELGYVGFAVDLYGDGKIAHDPKTAQAYAKPFYENPALAKERLDAAYAILMNSPQVDQAHIAAVGYCFGGGMLLNMAKMGMKLQGVVSFHGSLNGVPATAGSTRAAILVCHGEADQFVSADEIRNFKNNLDSVKADYTFLTYANATHAFTNPDATATGKKFHMPIEYNAKADQKSWKDMKLFLAKIFGETIEIGERGK